MGVADTIQKKFGSNLSESLGVRREPQLSVVSGQPSISIPAHTPDEGRTRDRNAGFMDISRIIPDPNQPRKTFSSESIERLAQSFKSHGQLLPVRIRYDQALQKWVLLSGERRYRAALKADLKNLACIFVDRELTQAERLEEQLLENIQRSDLLPTEQAKAFQQLMELKTWSAQDLAEAMGLSKPSIIKTIALLKLPEDIQRKVDAGEIPPSAAYELVKLDTAEEQQELAAQLAAKKLTRDQASREVKRRKGTLRKDPESSEPQSGGTTISYTLTSGTKVSVTVATRTVSTEQIVAALRQALAQAEAQLAMQKPPQAA